jgi:hypothetical protein
LVFSSKYTCDKYSSFTDALFKLNDKSILLKINEIDMFLMFNSVENYLNFMKDAYKVISPYQIVLDNWHQKVVIHITGFDEDITLVRTYCKDLFKANNILTNDGTFNQIMVNTWLDGMKEVHDSVIKLEDYIYAVDKKLSFRVKIHRLIPEDRFGVSYTTQYIQANGDVDDHVGYLNSPMVDEYDDGMKKNTINISNNTSVIKNKLKPGKLTDEMRDAIRMDAEKWVLELIKQDALNNKSTKETHDNYVNHKENSLSIQEFGRLVSSHGYRNKKRGNEHTWVKK